jgi:hypothetical protein
MSSNAPERPHGQRFSQVYLRPAELLSDSSRARRRVAALLDSMSELEGISSDIVGELGVDPIYGYDCVNWARTLERFSAQDFFDIFTIVCRYLLKKRNSPERFVAKASRIFAEEDLRYEIDSGGGVHFRVDAEFAANTHAAIAALSTTRYANAREQFELAMAALSAANIDGKQGIRGVFAAAECVFKLMYDRSRLAAGDVRKSLKPTVHTLFSDDPTALRAATASIEAFADWVDACHNYRHEQGVEEPLQPPLDLAVQLISVGSGFLRWLIAIDGKLQK